MLSTFLEKFQTVMYELSREGFLALSSAYGPILTGLMMISVALFGIRAAAGAPVRVLDLGVFFMKAAGIFLFATVWLDFAVAIQLPLQDGADGIANALLAGLSPAFNGSGTAMTLLDDYVAAGFEVSGELFSLASWDAISPLVMSVFVALTTLALAVTALFVVGMAKLLMGLCAATAPLFLSFLLFETTTPFFQRWLAAFFAAALTIIFAYAMLGAILVTSESMIADFEAVSVDDDFGWDDAVGYVIVSNVATLVLVYVSSFAASIAGGGASIVTATSWRMVSRAGQYASVASRARPMRSGHRSYAGLALDRLRSNATFAARTLTPADASATSAVERRVDRLNVRGKP